jgi:mannose/cellobiose epimerase-like protein (N-acyl-D-glucosamine 2-epimerase family)
VPYPPADHFPEAAAKRLQNAVMHAVGALLATHPELSDEQCLSAVVTVLIKNTVLVSRQSLLTLTQLHDAITLAWVETEQRGA